MAKKINNESFIDPNFLVPVLEKTKELVELIGVLKDDLKETGKEAKKTFEGFNPAEKVKDTEELNKTIKKLVEAELQLAKLKEAEAKAKKAAKKLTDDEIKQGIKLREEKQKRNKAIQASLVLQQKEIKSISELTKRNKALKLLADGLNQSTKEGSEEFKKLTNEIEDNKEKAKELTEEVKKERKQRKILAEALEQENKQRQGLIKTKQDAIDANKALRQSVNSLDTTTQGQRIEELNALIDENSKLIEENSDTQNKAKINIGRYTEAVEKALEGNEDFEKIQKALNILAIIQVKLFGKQEDATEKQKDATEDLTEANEDLAKSSEKVDKSLRGNIIGVIISGLTAVLGLFSQTSEGSETLAVNLAKLNITIQFLFGRAKAASLVAIDEILVGFKKLERGIENLSTFELFNSDETVKKAEANIKILDAEIIALGKRIEKNATRTTIDFTTALKEQLAAIEKLTLAERKFRNEQRNISKQTAELRKQQEILQELANSEALSLAKRDKLGINAIKTAQLLAKTEQSAVTKQIAFTEEKIRQQLVSEGLTDVTIAQIRDITNLEELRKRVSSELLDQQTEQLIELSEKQSEAIQTQLDGEELLSVTRIDAFERKLDDEQDFTAAVIERNQRIIASDTETLEAKIKAQENIDKQLAKSFQNQIKLSEEIIKQGIETEINKLKIAGASQSEILKLEEELLQFQIDASDILQSKNGEEFNQRIRNLKSGERVENRLLGVFKDRVTTQQDEIDNGNEILAQKFEQLDLETELANLEKENAQLEKLREEENRISKIENLEERAAAVKKFNEEIENIESGNEEELLEQEIENLKTQIEERIELEQDGSTKVLDLKKELAEKELELNRKKLDQERADTKEALDKDLKTREDNAKKRADLIDFFFDLEKSLRDKRNEKVNEEFEEQLTAVEKRQDELRDLANNGNEEAVKSLAESEKREAEIRQEKEKELKKQQQIEAGLAAFKLLASYAEQDPNTALGNTTKDIALLTTLISSLPSFFEGTEDTGTVANPLDGNGGRLAMIHDNERYIPKALNEKLGGISNKELVDLATNPRQDFIDFNHSIPENSVTIINDNNQKELANIMKESNEILKRLPSNMARTTDSFDSKTGVYTQLLEYGNTKRRTHKKLFTSIRK